MDWIECESCGEEYRIVSSSMNKTNFCPFCGTESEGFDLQDLDYDWDNDY